MWADAACPIETSRSPSGNRAPRSGPLTTMNSASIFDCTPVYQAPNGIGEPDGSPARTLRFTKRGGKAAPASGIHDVSTTYKRGRQHERSGRPVAFLSSVDRE